MVVWPHLVRISCKSVGRQSSYGRIYPAILVKHFDNDGRRRAADAVDRAVDDNSVEDEHLVPGRTQCLLDHLCTLALVDEHDTRERVWQARLVGANETASLVHMSTQLKRLPFCQSPTITQTDTYIHVHRPRNSNFNKRRKTPLERRGDDIAPEIWHICHETLNKPRNFCLAHGTANSYFTCTQSNKKLKGILIEEW